MWVKTVIFRIPPSRNTLSKSCPHARLKLWVLSNKLAKFFIQCWIVMDPTCKFRNLNCIIYHLKIWNILKLTLGSRFRANSSSTLLISTSLSLINQIASSWIVHTAASLCTICPSSSCWTCASSSASSIAARSSSLISSSPSSVAPATCCFQCFAFLKKNDRNVYYYEYQKAWT